MYSTYGPTKQLDNRSGYSAGRFNYTAIVQQCIAATMPSTSDSGSQYSQYFAPSPTGSSRRGSASYQSDAIHSTEHDNSFADSVLNQCKGLDNTGMMDFAQFFGLVDDSTPSATVGYGASAPLQPPAQPQSDKNSLMLNKADQQALQTQQGQSLKVTSLARQVNSLDSSLDADYMADAAAADADYADVEMSEADEHDMDGDIDSHSNVQIPQSGGQAEAVAALPVQQVTAVMAQRLATGPASQPVAAQLHSLAPSTSFQHDASLRTHSAAAFQGQARAMSAGHSDTSSGAVARQGDAAHFDSPICANSASSAQARFAAAALAETASVPQTQIDPDMIEDAETAAEQAAQLDAPTDASAAVPNADADTDMTDADATDTEQAAQLAAPPSPVPQAHAHVNMPEAVEADAEQQQQPAPTQPKSAIATRTRSRKRRAESEAASSYQAAAAAAVPNDQTRAPEKKRQKRSQAAAITVAGQRAAAAPEKKNTRGARAAATAVTTSQRAAGAEKKNIRGSRTAATAVAGGGGGARDAATRGRKPATAPAWAKPELNSEQFAQAVKNSVVFAKMPGFSHWPAQVQTPTREQKKALGITRLPPNQSLVVFFTPQHQRALVSTKQLLSFEAGLGQMRGSKASAGVKAATDEAAAFVRSRLASPGTTPATLQ